MSEDFWDILLDAIMKGAVVPVVGGDLLRVADRDGSERQFAQHVAEILAEPTFALNEEDWLEFLLRLQDPDRRPKRLFDRLRQSHLLLIGNSFPDWLARFVLRILRGQRLSDRAATRLALADECTRGRRDVALVMFLKRFSRLTMIFEEGGAHEFIAQLHRRWTARQAPAAREESSFQPAEEARTECPAEKVGDVLYDQGDLTGALANSAALGSTGVILDSNGFDSTFSGAFTGTGGITKIDTGVVSLTGNNTYSGGTTITNGTLIAGSDTAFGSGPVIIQPAGTLGGSATIFGDLTNLGTLSPVNPPGVFTVKGNFTQTGSGVYNVQIASASSYSRLVINGRATLDGTVRLTLSGGYLPSARNQFVILTAGQGIQGTFRTVISPANMPFALHYSAGLVTATPVPMSTSLADGSPASTTSLISNYGFYDFRPLNGRLAQAGTSANANFAPIAFSYDAGEFNLHGQHGSIYTIPINGQYSLSQRLALNYAIPLQYLQFPGTHFLEGATLLDLPAKVLLASESQPLSWTVAPGAAFAVAGTKELIGGAALTNVLSYRWHNINLTYGNYVTFLAGHLLTHNDPFFVPAVNQQIMKNGLRVSIPFAKGTWLFEVYGIHTQFFQTAAVSSYITIGAELGRHIVTRLYGHEIDLGYLSAGLYAEWGNHYSSDHFEFGSAWKF